MTASRVSIVDPPDLPRAVGYAHGAIASGRTLYVAGQIGTDADGALAGDDLPRQFARALDNVLAVVDAAGAGAQDLARMTVYVTDVGAYRACRAELGRIWRARLGRHYPAMALVGVAELVEPGALVEIEAVAALPAEGE